MSINRKAVYSLGFGILFLSLVCCGEHGGNGGEDPNKPNPGKEDNNVTNINGTKIDKGNTLVGLISDSQTGKGIPGVPVTDGYTFTVTDNNGVYQMAGNEKCRNVYYTTPADYEISTDSKTGLPLFYSTKELKAGSVTRNDFKIKPLAAPEEEFTLVMVGDPQCQTAAHVKRYENETIPDIQKTVNEGLNDGSIKSVYAMTLGDIVFDSSDLWPDMKNTMSNVTLSNGKKLAFFNTIGNHDHFAGASDEYHAVQKYIDNFGPTDYSFNRGKVHFVVMDNVMCTEVEPRSSAPDKHTWRYIGGYSDEQYEWLKQDFEQIKDKANTMLIFCSHIPFRGGSNEKGSTVSKQRHYADFLNLFKDFKETHIMIGHTHYAQNYIHSDYVCKGGQPVYEHIHGAACGAWWACNSDVTGGPSGYNVYTVDGAGITDWYTKGTNREKDFQFRVFDGTETYSGTKDFEYTWYGGGIGGKKDKEIRAEGYAALNGCFVAQVWDDDDRNWKVEMYQDGKKLGDFTRIPNGTITNIAYTSYTFNELNKNTDTWVNKTASHYWYFKPANGKPRYFQNWEVRATHTVPGSGKQNVYVCNELTLGSDFAITF